MTTQLLTHAQFDELGRLDSSAVANAIEIFDVRLRNRGFANSSVHCIFEDYPPMVGYAATLQVRTSEPPMEVTAIPTDSTGWIT
jgi:hypothetical protein